MAVNIFGEGRHNQGGPGQKGIPGVGFKLLDNEGNYDIDRKRLANVASPESDNDAVTLSCANALYSDVYVSMGELESKLTDAEESLNRLDTLRLEGREEVFDRLEHVELSVDNVAKVSDGVKEDLEEYKMDNERLMDALRTELSRDTAKVVDLCNNLEEMVTSETSIETINSAITSLLLELRTVGSVLSTATGDVTINASEIEHIKVMVDRLKEKVETNKDGDESLTTVLSTIGDHMTTLENKFDMLEFQVSTLEDRIDNLVKVNITGGLNDKP